jgi:homoserine kinase
LNLRSGATDVIQDSVQRIQDGNLSYKVRVPASTSNLGAGFDCLSLSLQLYLEVTASAVPAKTEQCEVLFRGEGSESLELSCAEDNLIFRAMRFVAEREGFSLPPVQLEVNNDIPLGRGLGSSAAAIVAGITLSSLLCERTLSPETVLRYASALEGHADNVAAACYGGWVVSCVKPDGEVIAVKRPWPANLKVVIVSPETSLKTEETRSALPATVSLTDAVHNLQRAALFCAALETGAYELLWEAMQDRLHQRQRQSLVPGLAEALATPRQSGLMGIALSGSGPSVVALTTDWSAEIGETIASNFRSRGLAAMVRILEADNDGHRIR